MMKSFRKECCFTNARDKIIVQKIIGHTADLISYLKGMDFAAFISDKKTISACAFTVGQIGELAKHISEETSMANPQIPLRSMKGMRNKIVHDYEHINLTVLYETITRNIPELKLQLEQVLAHDAAIETRLKAEQDDDEQDRKR